MNNGLIDTDFKTLQEMMIKANLSQLLFIEKSIKDVINKRADSEV